MFALIYFGCFLLPWVFLFVYWIKNKKNFGFDVSGFESIDGKEGEARIQAITELYENSDKVEELIKNGHIFFRRSHLEGLVGEKEQVEKMLSLLLSALLGGLATSLFAIEFMKRSLSTSASSINEALCCFLFVLAVSLCFLVVTFLNNREKDEVCIHRYEVECNLKAVERYIDIYLSRGLTGDKVLVNAEGKWSLLTLK